MSRKLEFLETSNDLYAINNSFSYLKNPYGHKINITEKVIDDNMLSDRGSSLDIPGLSIEKMDKKLGLNIGDEIIHAALPYLEIRHLLVHGQGKADADFCTKYPFIGAEEGKLIELEHSLINNARNAIITLVKEFDKKIVANGLVETTELQP